MKIKLLMFCLLICAVFSACASDNNKINSQSTADESLLSKVPSSLKKELMENLAINAKIIFDKNVKWKEIPVKHKIFDKDTMLQIFAKNKKITEQNELDNWGTNGIGYAFDFDDGSWLVIDPGELRYTTEYYSKKMYDITIHENYGFYTIRDDLKDIYVKKALDGIDKQEAINTVESILQKLGVSTYKTPNVYALDYDTLMNELDKDDFIPKEGYSPTWEKDDEAYLIEFFVGIDDIPMSNKGYVEPEINIPLTGGRISAVVSKYGLIYFSCEGIFEQTSSFKYVELISFESALNTIQLKYDDIILTDPTTITEVSAELLPVCTNSNPLEFSLIPVWSFRLTQNSRDTKTETEQLFRYDYLVFVNGITGEEIRTGGIM